MGEDSPPRPPGRLRGGWGGGRPALSPASSDPCLALQGKGLPGPPVSIHIPRGPQPSVPTTHRASLAARSQTRAGVGLPGGQNSDSPPRVSCPQRGQVGPTRGSGSGHPWVQMPTCHFCAPGRGRSQRAPRWTWPPGPPGEWLPQTFPHTGKRPEPLNPTTKDLPNLPPFASLPSPSSCPLSCLRGSLADVQPRRGGGGGELGAAPRDTVWRGFSRKSLVTSPPVGACPAASRS